MYGRFRDHLVRELDAIDAAGLTKRERILESPQDAHVRTDGREVLNMCANNYLGLADHPEIVGAARDALDRWGYGLASVRFICGTQRIHRDLETRLSAFLGTEDTILYSSCFDANGGLFETLLTAEDAVISDELNHASIIDGIRLCKAQRFRYKNNDMHDLERKLREAAGARFRMIATDGVFSMDGIVADLPSICDLADKYDALVMVDDSHAVGFMGEGGRGTHEYQGVMGRVDILTGTLGKALGGASGGYTSGRKEIIAMLRQRSRPYLFSNSVAPTIVAASLRTIDLLEESPELRQRLHPIVPIMLGDAKLANAMADRLLELGVYVVGFSYPVVPKGKARIRTQVSAAHSQQDLEFAVEMFRQAKTELGIGTPQGS